MRTPQRHSTRGTRARLLATLLLALPMLAFAQSLAIVKSTVDGGGGRSTGGPYAVHGTIGQPDASSPMSGGAFALTGGFWTGAVPAAPAGDAIFSNGFE